MNEACKQIAERCGTILRRSADFYSMPQGYDSPNEYLNICLALETDMSLLELLFTTKAIERSLGRTLKNQYADRTIDIDLLQAFDSEGREIRVATKDLTLPHPRMHERDFVLVPLQSVRQ